MSTRNRDSFGGADPEEVAERGSPVVFEKAGVLVLPRRRGSRIAYADIVHVARSESALAIGTARDTLVLRQRAFAGPEAMEALERALKARVGAESNGAMRLARIAELDAAAASRRPRAATLTFMAVCLLVFLFQWGDPFLTHVGVFAPGLFRSGEVWRLFTAHFLHDPLLFPIHLGLNLLCIGVIGLLVERVLGSGRTIVVMGFAAVGSAYGCWLAGYHQTLGASGVAAGLAGALLCIEFNGSRRLPVWWRIPRRVFVAAILAQAVLDYFVPFVAGAAHLGGFFAGYLVTRFFVSGAVLHRPPARLTQVAAAAVLLAVACSALAAAPLLRRDGRALESHGLRVLQSEFENARDDNTVAWVMVAESRPSELGAQVAAALAERAVAATDRRNPDLLDTLAEALFALGDVPGALIVIDEAIDLTGGERYFVEQRRRFMGERAPEDRPEAPEWPWRGSPRSTPNPFRPSEPGGSEGRTETFI